ncbi:fimbrial protein [Scandinavium sp. H11S7]|uniref:Fimbrial protein n=1 Tax=Scandinavium hiltneri TaxID=2926519 RepID=A0ABT2E4Y1_9ENTR|nr:fimbrial protein [Scandinavium hiltneri]MCS2155952.1 fimbrial protein [Scandinavium hiltneri]MCS2162478.1 fimbrial protein [Scandinavium hiltneri]
MSSRKIIYCLVLFCGISSLDVIADPLPDSQRIIALNFDGQLTMSSCVLEAPDVVRLPAANLTELRNLQPGGTTLQSTAYLAVVVKDCGNLANSSGLLTLTFNSNVVPPAGNYPAFENELTASPGLEVAQGVGIAIVDSRAGGKNVLQNNGQPQPINYTIDTRDLQQQRDFNVSYMRLAPQNDQLQSGLIESTVIINATYN